MDSIDDPSFIAELYSTFYYEAAGHISALTATVAAASRGAETAAVPGDSAALPLERRVRDAVSLRSSQQHQP